MGGAVVWGCKTRWKSGGDVPSHASWVWEGKVTCCEITYSLLVDVMEPLAMLFVHFPFQTLVFNLHEVEDGCLFHYRLFYLVLFFIVLLKSPVNTSCSTHDPKIFSAIFVRHSLKCTCASLWRNFP